MPASFLLSSSLVSTFFRPLQFRILTTQPLFLPFPSSCFRLTVAFPVLVFSFRFLRLPRFLLPDFSCFRLRLWYSYLLFVSFHPSLIRSHSCSSGAYFKLSLSVFSASLPLSFVRFRFASGYSAFCFSLSASSCSCLTAAVSVLDFCFRFFRLPRYPLPDFSCIPSRFSYSALCPFPFVLPCFAPAAVPQVIPFRDCCLAFVFFRPLLL